VLKNRLNLDYLLTHKDRSQDFFVNLNNFGNKMFYIIDKSLDQMESLKMNSLILSGHKCITLFFVQK
jgi:hypothetical protein